MKENRIQILVVDDHYVVRMGLIGILSHLPEFRIIGDAEDGPGALALFRKHRPDITLLDLRMPGMNGVETTIAIRQEFPNAKIIILTTYDQEEDIYRVLQAGAQGYLSKRTLGQELVAAIKKVHAGGRHIPKAINQRLAGRDPRLNLTERELQILQVMIKGLNNNEIGQVMGCTRFTVKFHVQNILRKLGVSDRTEAVGAAIERGVVHLD